MTDRIAIASDHAGYDFKEAIKQKFTDVEWVDLGTETAESVDYPDFGQALGQAITDGDAPRGVLICGSGIGISIAANRFPAVRAALCVSVEMAALSRRHNDANVLAIGQRLVDQQVAFDIVETFLNTEFEGGRHQRRVDKLTSP